MSGDLEQELTAAYRARRRPGFELAAPEEWVKAINSQLSKGEEDLAEFAVKLLHKEAPELVWARNMVELFDRMPAPVSLATQFRDRVAKDVQIVRRNDADMVIFCFCGNGHRFGMPLPLVQRLLLQVPASVVYLRDFHKAMYLKGIRSLGDGVAASVAALRAIARDLDARQIFSFGYSTGGFAAIRYGLELGAAGIVSFAGPVNLDPKSNTRLVRAGARDKLRRQFPDEPLDMRPLYAAASPRPPLVLIYGEHSWDDRLQAQQMAGMPGVRPIEIAGFGEHSVLREMVQRRQFDGMLEQLFQDAGGDDVDNSFRFGA